LNPNDTLLALIDDFTSGRDRSMSKVGEIEDLLVREYLDTEVFEAAAEALALYRPGEGLPYMDEAEMEETLLTVREMIS
jgi:hypothetical protein